MSTVCQAEPQEFLSLCINEMAANPVIHHEFLLTFESASLSREQLLRFALQWYKTAKSHKEAFPALVFITRDDDVRFELIDILNEEYGSGNREQIHGRLLLKFLKALGISEIDVSATPTLPEVTHFAQEVLRVWRDGHPTYAFGLHFALEYLASSLHVHFANGLEKYSFLTPENIEYFTYHRIAEQRHADFSEIGFLRYASDPDQRPYLHDGVKDGVKLLHVLWEGFHAHVFGEAGEASPAR